MDFHGVTVGLHGSLARPRYHLAHVSEDPANSGTIELRYASQVDVAEISFEEKRQGEYGSLK